MVERRRYGCVPPLFYENATHNPLAHIHKTKAPITKDTVLAAFGFSPTRRCRSSSTNLPDFDGWRESWCATLTAERLGIPQSAATELLFRTCRGQLVHRLAGENS